VNQGATHLANLGMFIDLFDEAEKVANPTAMEQMLCVS